MTGCKIGRVTLKNGAEIVPIKNTNMTLYSSGVHWTALKEANKLVHEGRASMVAVSVIFDDGMTLTNFSKRDDIDSTQAIGAVQMLADYCMIWAKGG